MSLDTSQINEIITPFLKKNGLFLLLFISGIGLTLFGLFQNHKPAEDIQLVRAQSVAEQNSMPKIYVDVSGAVVAPGMYELEEGARIQDALVKAGGFDSRADRAYISQYLNLAQKLTDGTKLFIPKENEEGTTAVRGATSVSELININTASESELDSLPAVGMVTAGKMIQNRPYQDIGDLVTKKVIGQKTYDKIKDLITVY